MGKNQAVGIGTEADVAAGAEKKEGAGCCHKVSVAAAFVCCLRFSNHESL